MATSKSKDGGVNVRYDDFIKKVRPDVTNPEEVVLLHGYIGDSGKEDQIRVYSDAGLTEYIDIAKADILHAVPNSDDPLGGSQLWVKQSSNVNYNDPHGYAQGEMYNDYMSDSYAPDNFGTAGPVPILTRTVICGPTRFICPTPQSRLVICTIRPTIQINCQRTIVCPTQAVICQRPSWVDACPTRLGCNPGATVVNPGGGQFSDDYGSGDVYDDYMNETYDGGAAPGGFAPVTTSPQCFQLQTRQINCQISLRVICITQNSPCISRQIICLSRNLPCITRYKIRSICRPCWETPRFTRFPTIQTPGNPVAGGGFNDAYGSYDDDDGGENTGYGNYTGGGYDDYSGGDLYNDYMANDYSGDAGNNTNFGGPAPTITIPQVCTLPPFTPRCPVTLRCFSPRTPCCPVLTPRCPITQRCPITPGCPFTPGGGRPPVGGSFDQNIGDYDSGEAYGDYSGGENYGDYGSGDMYGDYMANDYTPDAGAETGAAAGAITAIQLCNRPTRLAICWPTNPLRCRTLPNFPPCRTRFFICPTNPGFPPCNVTKQPIILCRLRITAIPRCFPTGICAVNPGGPIPGAPMNDPYGGFGENAGGENNGDYGSGDMYGDYMANDYAPDAGAETGAAAGAITAIQLCTRPTPLAICWPTNPLRCRTLPNFPPCRTRFPFCRTNPAFPPCRRTIAIHVCFPTNICAVNPGGPNPGTPMNDPYGGYGY